MTGRNGREEPQMKMNGYRISRGEENARFRRGTRMGRTGKTGLRILAAGLSLSMLLSGCGPASMTPLTVPDGVEQMESALQQDSGDRGAAGRTDTVITGFGSLPEEIREQTVQLGTTIEELKLPDTLEAHVAQKGAGNEEGGGKSARRF